jgi:hypothetical protein
MGLITKELGFDFWWGQEIFLFYIAFRPALGPTQPPIQWEPEVKWQGQEADHAKVQNAGAIPPLLHVFII